MSERGALPITEYSGESVESQRLLQWLTVRRGWAMDFSRQLRPYDFRESSKIWYCGTQIGVQAGRIVQANFCRSRWCPVCQWKRSRLLGYQNAAVIAALGDETVRYVFLTLTVRSCKLSELGSVLHEMSAAWNRMKANRAFKKLGILGGFRTTEITYNPRTDLWHPHFHTVFVLPKSLWLPSHDWWCSIWGTSLHIDYKPVVDIRVVRDLAKGAAEVSKYCVKSEEMLRGFDFSEFAVLKSAVGGHRFANPFGVWRDKRKELGFVDIDRDRLVDQPVFGYPVTVYDWEPVFQRYFVSGVTTEVQ